MVNNYAVSKTKLMSCCRTIIAAFTIFSFLFGLSMAGTTSVAASSQIIGGGQQLEGEEQQRQRLRMCGTNGGVADGTDANTTTTITGTDDGNNNKNNNSNISFYQNPEYGIQIRHPEDWIYLEDTESAFPLDFFNVALISTQEAFEVGTTPESGGTPEIAPSGVGIMVSELPFGNADLRQFGDYFIGFLTSEGHQIISTNYNATLSGMPAFEVVTVEPDSTRHLYLWTIQGDRAYNLAYASHESRFDQSLPIAQEMINSFTITDEISATSTLTDNNINTTTGIAGAANNSTTGSLYQNPEYGIQMLCPEDWIHMESETAPPFDLGVAFIPLSDLLGSGANSEMDSGVSVLIGEPIFGITDLRQLEDFITDGITSDGDQIISINSDATLSGMPAFEVVFVEPQNRTKELQLWAIQGDRMYNVVYLSHESRFDQSLPIAQEMINSFTITDESNSATTAPNTSTTSQQFQTPTESSTTTTTTNGGITDTDNNQVTDLEAARQQYLAVWNQTEFQVAFNTYIEPGSATGYGIYEERENNNIFRPGETIQLYAEPVGFGHQLIIDDARNTLYSIDLAADIILSDVNGNELVTIEDLPMPDIVSHRQNTELHLTLTVTQESPFPVGDYIVSYIVYDQVTGESIEIDNRITIAAEEDDNAGTANATTPIQGRQQQQQQQQLQPEQVEWLQYENATYGVGMLYPSDWLLTGGAAGEDGRFVTVSNFYSPEETDWAYVFTAIDNMPTNLESSLNDTINAYNLDPFVRDFQVLSTSMNNFTIAGMPAYTLEATYTDTELGPQHLLAVETIIDNKGYAIQYIASPPTYQQYFPTVERMIESFEIMQQLQQEEEGERQQQQLQQEQGMPQQN